MKISLTFALLMTFVTIKSQDCYVFSSKKTSINLGYYYNQGNNLLAINYKNVTISANYFKVGIGLSYEGEYFYINAEHLNVLKDQTVSGLPMPPEDLAVNYNLSRFSGYGIFGGNKEIRPLLGFTIQSFGNEEFFLPEIGLLAKFQHFDLHTAFNSRMLRASVLFGIF